MFLMNFKTSSNKKVSSHQEVVLAPQNKMHLQKEKKHHLLDLIRTRLLESFIPSQLWVESISTTVPLINLLPSSNLLYQSPYFELPGHHPNCNHLHTFGCLYFVHPPSSEQSNLSAQSAQCAFLGYAAHQKRLLCNVPSLIAFIPLVMLFSLNINIFFNIMHLYLPQSSLSSRLLRISFDHKV